MVKQTKIRPTNRDCTYITPATILYMIHVLPRQRIQILQNDFNEMNCREIVPRSVFENQIANDAFTSLFSLNYHLHYLPTVTLFLSIT